MKICTVCNENKLLDEYYNYKQSKDGKSYRCKLCDNLARKSYDNKHRERRLANQRKANRKAKYGLFDDQFRKMISDQCGLCAICDTKLVIEDTRNISDNRLAIDHDHKTNKVRGLLCYKCNRGLGHFLDDADLLQKAMEYLRNAEIH